jgi:AraC-like DNA-binding protein
LSQTVNVLSADLHSVEVEMIRLDGRKQVSSGIKSGHYGYLVLKGTLRMKSQNGESSVRAGELGWVGGGLERTITSSRSCEWLVLRIRNRCFAPGNTADRVAWETLMRLSTLSRSQQRVPLNRATLSRLHPIVVQLMDWTDATDPGSITMRKALLLQFLVTLRADKRLQNAFSALPDPQPRLDLLQQALLLIDRDAAGIKDIKDLATRTGTSRSALYRLFHSAGFPTPATMLEHARIESAARRLRESDQSVLDIAFESGFASLSSFYRSFQRIHGIPPGKWRRLFPLFRER